MSFRSSVLFCGIVLSASCICALPVHDDDNSRSDHIVAVLDLEGRLNETASEHTGEHFFCSGSSYLKSKTCSASATALNVYAGTTFQCRNDYLCTPPRYWTRPPARQSAAKTCSDLAAKVQAKVNDHSWTFDCSGHIAVGGRWYCLRLMPSNIDCSLQCDCKAKLEAFNKAVPGLRPSPTPSPTAQPTLPTQLPGSANCQQCYIPEGQKQCVAFADDATQCIGCVINPHSWHCPTDQPRCLGNICQQAALPTCPWSYADGQCEIRASGIQTNDNSNPTMLINRWMQSNSWWLGREWSNYRGSCWRDGSSTGPPSNDVVLTFTFSQSTPVNAFRMNAYRSGLHAVNVLPRQFKIQYQNAAGTWMDIPCTGSSCSSGQPPHRSGGGWRCSGVTNQWAVYSYAHNRQIEFDFSSSQCVVTKTMRIALTAQTAGTSNAGNGFGFVRQMTFFHKQSGTAPCSTP